MAVKLNLLPEGYGVSGSLGKILKTTKALGVIALAVFIVFTIGMSAFFIFSTITLNGLKNEKTSLGVEIQSLQTTETQTVLLKDRLDKVKIVFSSPSAIKNLLLVDPLVTSLGPSSSLSELNVGAGKIDLILSFRSSVDLSAFYTKIADSQNFTTVRQTSFSYAPANGYSVGLSLTPK